MLQVTNLLITMHYLAVLANEAIPTQSAVVSKEIILKSAKTDLDMSQDDSSELCLISSYKFDQILCPKKGPFLKKDYCVTYDENTKIISLFNCPYYHYTMTCYNKTKYGWIILPRNLSQLNDYMCGPLNRRGTVCSECADGFGPSVTSFGYRCVNCTDAWYGVPLFLLLEFVPITVFYLIILVFQISISSAPMPCFIMYAQFVIIAFDSSIPVTPLLKKIIPIEQWNRRLSIKIGLSLYRVFNLEFGRYLLPPFCVSSKLKFFHIVSLGYVTAFYPILLVFLTWICIELHGRNFRPLVWLWKPFHRCFVCLQRGWDTKSDIIDVFTTFFLLSYGKIMYLTLLLLSYHEIKNVNKSGQQSFTYQCLVDQSILYGSKYHLSFAIPAVFISFIFNILPLLLLVLYPTRPFRSCLAKLHLNSIALSIFIEKIQGCYRNGLNKERDMRSFSGLYFFLQFVPFLISALQKCNYTNHWYYWGTIFLITSLIIAFVRPYRKAYMNYSDALLLSNLAVLSFTILAGSTKMLEFATLMLAAPILILILAIAKRLFYPCVTKHISKCKCLIRKYKEIRSILFTTTTEITAAVEPLVQPTRTELSYGINDNDTASLCEVINHK